jgi:hypothetical protein
LWPHFDRRDATPEPRSPGPTQARRTEPQPDGVPGSADDSESSPTVRP